MVAAVTVDYSQSYKQGVDHSLAYFQTLSPPDGFVVGLFNPTFSIMRSFNVRVVDGTINSHPDAIYVGPEAAAPETGSSLGLYTDWPLALPITQYLPVAGAVSLINFNTGSGYRLYGNLPAYPDPTTIALFVKSEYTVAAGSGEAPWVADFDAWLLYLEQWVQQVQQSTVTSADVFDATGKIAHLTFHIPVLATDLELGEGIESLFTLDTKIIGTDFDDQFTSGAGADEIQAGKGADTIKEFKGADTIDGGENDDTLKLTVTSADLNAAGDDKLLNVETISAKDAAAGVTIELRSQTEGFIIEGSALDDTITGGAGADTIKEFKGADTLDGDAGQDVLKLTATSLTLNAATDDKLRNLETVSAKEALSGVVIDLHLQTDGFTIDGSAGVDKITGSKGNDHVNLGDFGSTVFGTNGSDIITGGAFADTFDFIDAPDKEFSGFDFGLIQELDGKSFAGGFDSVPDRVRLPFAPNDYAITTTLGADFNATHTVIELESGPQIDFVTKNIEKVVFDQQVDNRIALDLRGGVVKEAVQLAINAYPEVNADVADHNWHPLSAIELGIAPSGYGGVNDYTFIEGKYDSANAQAIVATGIFNSQRTVTLDFAGTDTSEVWDVLHWAAFEAHYRQFSPLIAALKEYVADSANGIQQLLISGHSLGAAITQLAIADDWAVPTFGYTMATPGATKVPLGAPMINFLHSTDVISIAQDPTYLTRGVAGFTVIIDTPFDPNDLIATHDKFLYQDNIARFVDFAFEEGSLFFDTPLARSVRDNTRFFSTGAQEFALGTGLDDELVALRQDNYVLGGAGADSVIIGPLDYAAGGNFRSFDGGSGNDTIVFEVPFPKDPATLARTLRVTPSGQDVDIELDGEHVGKARSIEKIVIGIYEFDGVGIPANEAAANLFSAPVAPLLLRDSGEDAPFSQDLLANASDPGGGALTVLGLATSVTSTGGRILTLGSDYTLVGTTLTLTAAGLARFNSLSADQSDRVTFPYEVANEVSATASSLTLEIGGANDAPQLGDPIPDQVAVAGSAFVFAPSLTTFNDVDDGDRLTFSASLRSDAAFSALLATGAPLPSWISLDAETGQMTGQPTAADVGVFEITLTATDRSGLFASDTFEFVVRQPDPPANHAPVIDSDGGGETASIIISDDAKFVTGVKATDADTDAKIEYSLADPADRKLFKINSKTGELSFKSEPPEGRTYQVEVVASDGQLQDNQTIEVQVARGPFANGNSGVSDTFVFDKHLDLEIVSNFDAAQDVLEFDHRMFRHLDAKASSSELLDVVKDHSFQIGCDLAILTDSRDLIYLRDTSIQELTSGNLVLA
jgi:Ca2+-binding RTX toxin-like protein